MSIAAASSSTVAAVDAALAPAPPSGRSEGVAGVGAAFPLSVLRSLMASLALSATDAMSRFAVSNSATPPQRSESPPA
eukprot:15468470-Alexandrium_andersonii.AAC.1